MPASNESITEHKIKTESPRGTAVCIRSYLTQHEPNAHQIKFIKREQSKSNAH